MIAEGKVAAFVTPGRDLCCLLVREGMEEKTVLKQWKALEQEPLCGVKEPQTYMVPMRDGVCLAADVYLPEKEGAVPAVLVRTP